jgi:phospholipid/cholesterol/gamma-HCH transport system substrate-binding protein
MDRFKLAVDSGDFNLKEISTDIVPTMNNTLIELQHLMIRIEGALNQYERSPGDILFKQEEIKKGPGEK